MIKYVTKAKRNKKTSPILARVVPPFPLWISSCYSNFYAFLTLCLQITLALLTQPHTQQRSWNGQQIREWPRARTQYTSKFPPADLNTCPLPLLPTPSALPLPLYVLFTPPPPPQLPSAPSLPRLPSFPYPLPPRRSRIIHGPELAMALTRVGGLTWRVRPWLGYEFCLLILRSLMARRRADC